MLIEIESLNRAAPGTYSVQLRVYGSSGAGYRASIYSYTRAGEPAPCAHDLVVNSTAGDLFARDFELRQDGRWRDSDGNLAHSLHDLLPAEVRALELEQTIDLQTIEVTA